MGADSQPLIIHTKLNRPLVPRELVTRSKLIERLNQQRQRPLTLVVAPAGYGKSTLLSSWLESLTGQPTAWLSLDEHDNDLGAFVNYFLAAIQTMFPAAGQETLTFVNSTDAQPMRVLVSTLLNELSQITQPYILVLDDYHSIRDKEVHEFISAFLTHPPSTMHLVLASRIDPLVPVSQLRASGLVTEIRANDLRFSQPESRTFLQNILTEPVDENRLANLYQKSEGWVTGLRLAALSQHLAGHGDEAATANNPYVTEYLMSVVLAHQSSLVQDCLLKTAILDRFCPELCEVVCATNGEVDSPNLKGASFLKIVITTNLFIIPLDSQNTWYRYHHLFAQFLQQTLRQRYTSSEIGRFHLQASAWLAENDLIDEALDHAIASGDKEWAAKLVEDNRHQLLDEYKWYILKRRLARLPIALIQQRPKLLLAQAWVAFYQHKIMAIPSILQAIDSLPNSEQFDKITKGELDFFWGNQWYWAGQGQRSLERLQRAVQRIPEEYKQARAEAELFFALAQHMMGQTQIAIQSLNQALYYDSAPESARVTRLLGSLIFIHLLSGNLDMAGQVNQKLRNVIQENNSEYIKAWIFYTDGLADLGLGNLEIALDYFNKVKEMRFIIHTRAAVDSLVGLALLYQMNRQTSKANETVQFLQTFALETDDPAYITIARSCAARLAVLQGDTEVFFRWLQTADLSTDMGFMFYWWEVPRITECRALIAAGSVNNLAEASEKLDCYFQENQTTHNRLRMIEILILQSKVNVKRKQEAQTLTTLEQAVKLAMPGGWVFPFLESGPELIRPLETLRSRNIAPDYIGRILNAFSQRNAIPGSARLPDNASLSRLENEITYREREVLALLANEMSNQEIARQLTISPNTVKRHTGALYRKLDVKNRRQAVTKAKQVGLLPAE